MKLLSGIAILGLVLSVAACGNNSSNAELVAKQQAEIEKLKGEAELAKAQANKLNDEAKIRDATLEIETETAKKRAEANAKAEERVREIFGPK